MVNMAFGCFWCLGWFRGGHRMRSWTYSSMTRGVWKTTGMKLEKNWLVKYMIESIITTPKREWHSRHVSYQPRRWKGQAGIVGSNIGVWKTRSTLWNKCWPQTTPPTSTATTHKRNTNKYLRYKLHTRIRYTRNHNSNKTTNTPSHLGRHLEMLTSLLPALEISLLPPGLGELWWLSIGSFFSGRFTENNSAMVHWISQSYHLIRVPLLGGLNSAEQILVKWCQMFLFLPRL